MKATDIEKKTGTRTPDRRTFSKTTGTRQAHSQYKEGLKLSV